MRSLKFSFDLISHPKIISDTPLSAICIHIAYYDLVQFSLNVTSTIFFSISSALVVLATEIVVLAIVVLKVIALVVTVKATVVVVVVERKYCLFGQSIISLIISCKLQINILSYS